MNPLPRSTDRRVLTDWLQAIDPAFALPIYIVPSWQARGARLFDLPSGVGGVHIACGRLRPLLERLGVWRGAGFTTILSGDSLLLDFDRLFAIVLHEFGHHFDTQRQATEEINISVAAFNEAMAIPPRGDESMTFPAYTRAELRRQHSPSFIRCCVHLGYRARCLGWRGNTRKIVDVPYYRFTRKGASRFVSAAEFRRALGDEPRKLRALPIAKVATIEPPASYQEFCRGLARIESIL